MTWKPNDHYAQRARKEDYKARSVYKLQEIDEKWHLLRPGMQVLDLGCSPGSWSQYASQQIGPKGRLLGIDLTPMTFQLANARFVEADIYTADFPALFAAADMQPPIDLVLSDMAPKTTGSRGTDQARSAGLCEMALWVAEQVLRPGGGFVTKMFEGPDTQTFRKLLGEKFAKVGTARPQAVRKVSKEIFLVATGFRRPTGE